MLAEHHLSMTLRNSQAERGDERSDMNLSLYQQRQLQQRATDLLTQTAPWLGPLGRRVLTALLVRTAQGWHVFLRPTPSTTDADAFLIGPGGVFTVLVRDQLPDEATVRAVA